MNSFGSSHLSSDDRLFIQHSLAISSSCVFIANALNKDPRTISKEIKLRRIVKPNGRFQIFGSKPWVCDKVNRFPFVCDNCSKIHSCTNQFHYSYNAKSAHNNYRLILSNSRTGLDCSSNDFSVMDSLLTNGVKNGQSIRHIVNSNKDLIPYSISSIYRLIDKQQTSIKNIDLIRKVKFKVRKHYSIPFDNNKVREGRTFSDFVRFISNNPCIPITEIDTVESCKGECRCLLTIHFTFIKFMIAFLIDSKSQANVSRVFSHLQKTFGDVMYKKMFPVILTDRGTEFGDPTKIEFNQTTGNQLTSVFYCNSYASYQKGAIEENHRLIRYVLPKGCSFDNLTQDKVNLILSHINSYNRQSLDSTPIHLAKLYFGQDFLDKLNIKEIPAKKVLLKPTLIK